MSVGGGAGRGFAVLDTMVKEGFRDWNANEVHAWWDSLLKTIFEHHSGAQLCQLLSLLPRNSLYFTCPATSSGVDTQPLLLALPTSEDSEEGGMTVLLEGLTLWQLQLQVPASWFLTGRKRAPGTDWLYCASCFETCYWGHALREEPVVLSGICGCVLICNMKILTPVLPPNPVLACWG